MIQAFDINWRNINGGKKWFVSKLVYALLEFFDHGHIVEKLYNNYLLPIDTDKKGNLYILNSEKDHNTNVGILIT